MALAQKQSYQSNHTPGRFSASFDHFNGTDKVTMSVRQGDILFINGEVVVNDGSVTLLVKKGKQVIFQKPPVLKNDTSDFYIPMKEPGTVTIEFRGRRASGKVLALYELAMAKTIQVTSNNNIELFGLMMQLDNAPDAIAAKDSVVINGRKTMWKDWYSLAVTNYNRYKAFDSCDMMRIYRQYMSRGFYNDFFIGFLLQSDLVPEAGINGRIDPGILNAFSADGKVEEAGKKATAFLQSFNRFYQEVQFGAYLQEYEKYYSTMIRQVRKSLPSPEFVPVMEHFYHKQFNGYLLVPSLNVLNTMGFGKMHQRTGVIANVFGPFDFMKFDKQNPDPGFDFPEKIQNLSLHEFGHSFVNPAIDKLPVELVQATESLYQPIKEAMSKHAYTNWQMCLYEHFVKAGEIMISRYMGQQERSARMMNDFVKDGFIYIPFIVKEMEQYEKIPYTERDYDSFVLTIMEHLRSKAQSR